MVTEQQENAREIRIDILERAKNGDNSGLDEDGFVPCDYML